MTLARRHLHSRQLAQRGVRLPAGTDRRAVHRRRAKSKSTPSSTSAPSSWRRTAICMRPRSSHWPTPHAAMAASRICRPAPKLHDRSSSRAIFSAPRAAGTISLRRDAGSPGQYDPDLGRRRPRSRDRQENRAVPMYADGAMAAQRGDGSPPNLTLRVSGHDRGQPFILRQMPHIGPSRRCRARAL